MHAAVEDVHHGRRQKMRVRTAHVLVQRQLGGLRGSLATAKEAPRMALAPSLPLFRGAVELDHQVVQSALVSSVHADDLRSDDLVHGLDRVKNTLAAVDGLVAIATLPASASPVERRTGPGPGPGRRLRCPERPERSGCRGNRESDARTRFQLLPQLLLKTVVYLE